jgi:tetratricopeptide (TPR) repeat protein
VPDARKAAFTVITVFVVPLLFFVLLEVGLRVAGVGTSFDYFRTVDIDGRTYYQENPDFADQFYPPSLDITPAENTFARDRGPDVLRVFILGGSAAQGFPHKNHGVDRLLAAQLRAALPAREIEVINTAMTSVNSHVVYEVARTIPGNSADFAVILMGNNEVVGPYGPGTFNQNFLSNIKLIRGIQALKRTRIWQALDGLIRSLSATDARQDLEWEGMQMFTEHRVAHDDPRMEGVYSHYEDNLAAIIEMLQDKGIHVLLSSVPVNLRDSAPFLSVRSAGMSNDQLDQWRELTRSGAENAAAQDWEGAARQFEAALQIDPGYADTHFRLATAYENLGEFRQATAQYGLALDLDALRFRADSRINQIIRRTAAGAGEETFDLVDGAAAFAGASEPFQPGWNLLLEHVHYSFSGNHVLAAEIARSIVSKVAASDDFDPLPGPEIARRTGFPNHDTVGEIKTLQAMIQQPPFPGQSNYTDLRKSLDARLARVTAEIGSPTAVVARRKKLVDAGLDDWKINFELAVLNQRLGNRPAMYVHLQRILELYPHNRESYIKIAEAMSEDGRWQEAIPYLEQSLHYTRGNEEKIAETIGWLGTAYLRTGNVAKATDLLLEVTREHSDQIGLTLRAYGNLIRHARDTGNTADLERYVTEVERYARALIRKGRDEEYPLLYRRMSQLMAMGGLTAKAREWAEAEGR